jgi:hypothetical protein
MSREEAALDPCFREAVMSSEPKEELPLAEAVTYLLEECRMVLPGLQALFGFN